MSSSSSPQQHRQRHKRRKPKRRHTVSPDAEIPVLEERIVKETPARGSLPDHALGSTSNKNESNNADSPTTGLVAFRSLPISAATLQGLEGSGYTTMTPIQARSIPHALAGRDVLGAAQTGSGKTLAFLIPMVEALYRSRWTVSGGGVGAIVLSPTRELAGQTFAVLKKIGVHHSSSLTVGLLMGGRNKKQRNNKKNKQQQQQQQPDHTPQNDGLQRDDFVREQQSLSRGNTHILICTPGRLLQHLEQTPHFSVDSLQMLVLDEADRLLDMGFQQQLQHILEYIPTERQTLLFSATQTKNVKQLARLSINRQTVEYIGISSKQEKNENTKNGSKGATGMMSTPDRLTQSYVVVPVEHKLNCVYSFLKSHLQCKTICFLSSCSQVRHVWDLFCRLRPGLSVLALHGKLSQDKRLQVYDKFTTTPHAVLFATDVASRGLDFPRVDWVVQIDAPEDADMYIHRVGRTARFQRKGQALLLLDPKEEACIVKEWPLFQQTNQKGAKIIKKKSINPTKTMLVSQRAAALVAEHASLHHLAKKAFLSHVRSISLLPTSTWPSFDVQSMNLDAYALSLGLASMPNLDFLQQITDRDGLRKTKNVNRKLQKLKDQIQKEKEKKRAAKKRKAAGDDEEIIGKDKGGDDDDWLIVKSRQEPPTAAEDEPVSKTMRKPKKIRVDNRSSIKFDDDGNMEEKVINPAMNHRSNSSDGDEEVDLQQANTQYMDQVRQRLAGNREIDQQDERERVRAKHKKKRMEEKGDQAESKSQLQSEEALVTLGSASGESSSDSESSSSSDSSDGSSSSSDDEDDDKDVAAQENLALSMIRSGMVN